MLSAGRRERRMPKRAHLVRLAPQGAPANSTWGGRCGPTRVQARTLIGRDLHSDVGTFRPLASSIFHAFMLLGRVRSAKRVLMRPIFGRPAFSLPSIDSASCDLDLWSRYRSK